MENVLCRRLISVSFLPIEAFTYTEYEIRISLLLNFCYVYANVRVPGFSVPISRIIFSLDYILVRAKKIQ